jgi:transposase InsO family protein
VQYQSIHYTDRLDVAKIRPSAGSVGYSCCNAQVETINGLYKTVVIHPNGPWRNVNEMEFATLELGRMRIWRTVEPSICRRNLSLYV